MCQCILKKDLRPNENEVFLFNPLNFLKEKQAKAQFGLGCEKYI